MKKIKSRNRPDKLETDLRTARRAIGRKIYFVMLILVILAILNYFFGSYVILKADGVIKKDFVAFDARFPSLITKVYKDAGDEIMSGEIMFEIVPAYEFFAEDQSEAELARSMIDTEVVQKKSSTISYSSKEVLKVEASVNGDIGAIMPYPGEVYLTGEEITSVYHGLPYVYVYMPKEYLGSIKLNEELFVFYGDIKETGFVEAILPVSGIIPAEFQNTIKAEGRNQIVKLRMKTDTKIPLLELVEVRKTKTIISSFMPFFNKS